MEYGLGVNWNLDFPLAFFKVLILVLMEYGLGVVVRAFLCARKKVLILVLMEYGLGVLLSQAA